MVNDRSGLDVAMAVSNLISLLFTLGRVRFRRGPPLD